MPDLLKSLGIPTPDLPERGDVTTDQAEVAAGPLAHLLLIYGEELFWTYPLPPDEVLNAIETPVIKVEWFVSGGRSSSVGYYYFSYQCDAVKQEVWEISRKLEAALERINPTAGLGPNGIPANLREAHFAASCSASPISALVTEKRIAAVGLTVWASSPNVRNQGTEDLKQVYAAEFVASAQARQSDVNDMWGYYCPFCEVVVDRDTEFVDSCTHLARFGIPDSSEWFGPYEADLDRLSMLALDAVEEEVNIPEILRGIPFWSMLQERDWEDLNATFARHPSLLELQRANHGGFIDETRPIHVLLIDEDRTGFNDHMARVLESLAIEMLAEISLNTAPVVISGLSSKEATEFLLRALGHDETVAINATFVAGIAAYGYYLGSSNVSLQMGQPLVRAVQRGLRAEDALVVLQAAQSSGSKAVRAAADLAKSRAGR